MISQITQEDADALIALSKKAISSNDIELPDIGGSVDIHFTCINNREKFVLNYTRNRLNLFKRNHHLRGREVIGLLRLDLDGPPHRNPDGEEIGPRHLHIYKEGSSLKWAYEIPDKFFKNLDNANQTLNDFMNYCNVVELPNFNKGLFS